MSDGKGSEAICPTCGKTFVRARKGHIYCSGLCKTRAHRQEKRARKKTAGNEMTAANDGKWSEAICPVCGGTFKRTRKGHTYCSISCGNNQRRKDKLDDEIKSGYGDYTHVCKICKKRFRSNTHKRSYCSDTCRQMAYEQNKKTQRMRDQGEDLLVMIMQDIPVNREMRPRVGKIYFAKRYTLYGSSTVIIPEIGKFGLVIRTGEYKIIKEA